MNNKFESIKITTGLIRLPVEVDGRKGKFIEFNPMDAKFMEDLHHFYKVILDKAEEWKKNAPTLQVEIDAINIDENEMPETLDPVINPLKEMNQFMHEQIDLVFGKGVTKDIFGDTLFRDPSIYIQLLEGVQAYMQPIRDQKIGKYIAKKTPRKRASKK